MKLLNNKMKNEFYRDGVLIIKNFYRAEDITEIQKGIYDIIGLMLKKYCIEDNRSPFNSETFDQKYNEIILLNRKIGSEIYDAVKQIPAFVRLVCNKKHDMLINELYEDSIPAVAAQGYGIRIDNPKEDQYRTFWHQEYPGQLRSLDGVVLWSPLINIEENLGPVHICLGSHKEGVFPVIIDSKDPYRKGAYSLKIFNEKNIIPKYKQIAPLTHPTDLIIMHFLVVHSSGYNKSDRSRWSMQSRYFNFKEPVGLSHGWQGSFTSNNDFRKVHPELFIPGENNDSN